MTVYEISLIGSEDNTVVSMDLNKREAAFLNRLKDVINSAYYPYYAPYMDITVM